MTTTLELLRAGPGPAPDHPDLVVACIEACDDCARACLLCADACLREPEAGALAACVRLDADCADLCSVTGRVLARSPAQDPALTQVVLQTCVAATRLCADECEAHPQHRHCQLAADACRRAEAAARTLLAAIVTR